MKSAHGQAEIEFEIHVLEIHSLSDYTRSTSLSAYVHNYYVLYPNQRAFYSSSKLF